MIAVSVLPITANTNPTAQTGHTVSILKLLIEVGATIASATGSIWLNLRRPAMSDLLDVRAVARLLSCHKSTVWRMIRQRLFPEPLRIGPQLRRWERSAVEAWIEAVKAGQDRFDAGKLACDHVERAEAEQAIEYQEEIEAVFEEEGRAS
jgi:excisionase family DNA binding protein